MKGKRRLHGKILLSVVSILTFSSTVVSFSITAVLPAKYEVRPVHLLFHQLSCFLLLTLLLFRNKRRSEKGSITARRDGKGRGTGQEAGGEDFCEAGRAARRGKAGRSAHKEGWATRGGTGRDEHQAGGRGLPGVGRTKHLFLRSRK